MKWRPKGPKAAKRCRVCGDTRSVKPTEGKIVIDGNEPIDTVALMCRECRRQRKATYRVPKVGTR